MNDSSRFEPALRRLDQAVGRAMAYSRGCIAAAPLGIMVSPGLLRAVQQRNEEATCVLPYRWPLEDRYRGLPVEADDELLLGEFVIVGHGSELRLLVRWTGLRARRLYRLVKEHFPSDPGFTRPACMVPQSVVTLMMAIGDELEALNAA